MLTTKNVKARLIVKERRLQRHHQKFPDEEVPDNEEAKAMFVQWKKFYQQKQEQWPFEKNAARPNKKTVRCFTCEKIGHISRDCPFSLENEPKWWWITTVNL